MRHLRHLFYTLLTLSSALLVACAEDDYIPKPRGFFRIDFPEKHYLRYDTLSPYSFEYPDYAIISPDADPQAEPYWINLDLVPFHGMLHLSYKPVRNNLAAYFEDTRNFVTKHIPKADDIISNEYHDTIRDIHGIIYDIKGSGVASTYQFCLTDSSRHFLRGALYFSTIPNNDSLSPVLDFVRGDMDHLISTLRWKDIH